MSGVLRVRQLGVVSYAAGLAAQQAALSAHQAAVQARAAAPQLLLLLEHTPVYTVGRRNYGGPQEEARLRALGADYQRTDRGGLITFHGPGQLVVYPLLNLKQLGISGPRRYVSVLEEAVIEVCRRLGVAAATSPHTGVWCGDDKICAMGIHLSQRVLTSHGLALNCDVELDWFRQIVPCGIVGKFVTSLSHQLNRSVTVAEASLHVVDVMGEMLNCEVVEEEEDALSSAKDVRF